MASIDIVAELGQARAQAAGRPARPAVSVDTLDAARRAYALTSRRSALMGAGLFGDPAWNILLDLFLSESEARPLCVTSVCIGSRASAATALRYLALLRGKGLVERIADPADRRRTYVRLSDRGWNAMVELLDGDGASEAALSRDRRVAAH